MSKNKPKPAKDYLDKTYDEICVKCRDKEDFPQCALQCYGFQKLASIKLTEEENEIKE